MRKRPTQEAMAKWVLATCELFCVPVATAHTVAGLFVKAVLDAWEEADAEDASLDGKESADG